MRVNRTLYRLLERMLGTTRVQAEYTLYSTEIRPMTGSERQASRDRDAINNNKVVGDKQ